MTANKLLPMDKTFLAIILAFLMILAFPFVIASEDNESDADDAMVDDSDSDAGETRIRERTETRELVTDAEGDVIGEIRTRKEVRIEERDGVLERSVFTRLREEQRTDLRTLSIHKLETLSKLRTDQLTKFRTVDKERLHVLAAGDVKSLRKFARLHEADIEKVAKLDRSRIKEFAELSPTEIRTRLEKIRIVKADEEFRLRPLTLEHTQRSNNAFRQLQENEVKLKERYEERLERLKLVKDRIEICKEDPSSENCDNVDADAVERAKETALHAADRIINHIEKIKSRLNSSEDLEEEAVAARTARLDALIEKVNGIKADIEAATTKEELNAAVRDLKAVTKKVKAKSKSHAQGLIRAHTIGIIHRSEIIEKKLDCSLSALEEDGINISSIDTKMDGVSDLIADTRAKLQEAKDVFAREDNASIDEAKSLIREARDSVKEAQEKLVDVRKDIIELGGTICTEDKDVAIEHEEVEDEKDDENEDEVEDDKNGDNATIEVEE